MTAVHCTVVSLLFMKRRRLSFARLQLTMLNIKSSFDPVLSQLIVGCFVAAHKSCRQSNRDSPHS